jgi:putative salt-induced outer membrane protein YdiY
MLDSGDTLTGELISVHKGILRLKHKALGQVGFEWKNLVSISTDRDVHVSLKNGDRITGQLVRAQEGHFRLISEKTLTREIELSEVVSINEPVRDVSWKGEALLTYVRTAGNNRTADLSFLFRGVRETEIDAISIKAAYDYGMTDYELSKRASQGILKYKYKLSRRIYTYLSAGAAMDYFTGLEMRTEVGGGTGWKVFDTSYLELSAELGLSYANEDYRKSVPPDPDRDVRYGAGRSALEGEANLSKVLTLYQLVEFVTPFDHAKLWRFHSESILSAALSDSLSLKAGYILDHDRRAAEGTKRTDGKTLVGIGFKF